jgi:sugar lactone lactonase YvrE
MWWGLPSVCPAGISSIVVLLAAVVLSCPCFAADSPAEPISVLRQAGAATSFAQPMGVAVDTVGGLVIIADTGNHRVRIFDLDGYPISSFPHLVDGPKGPVPGEPKSVAIDRQGILYVLDTQASYIDIMDLLGNSLGRIQPSELARALPSAPAIGGSSEDFRAVALALDSQDRLVLAVGSPRCRIWVLDENRTVVRVFDGSEKGGPALAAVTDLFVDREGRIYVTDGAQAPCVRVFSPEGTQLLAFGQKDTGDENFSLPGSVVATADGRIWVVDTIRQVVKVFDRNANLLGMVGGQGVRLGDLSYPSRLATDGRDRLYVLERVGARLTTFRIQPLAQAVSQ